MNTELDPRTCSAEVARVVTILHGHDRTEEEYTTLFLATSARLYVAALRRSAQLCDQDEAAVTAILQSMGQRAAAAGGTISRDTVMVATAALEADPGLLHAITGEVERPVHISQILLRLVIAVVVAVGMATSTDAERVLYELAGTLHP